MQALKLRLEIQEKANEQNILKNTSRERHGEKRNNLWSNFGPSLPNYLTFSFKFFLQLIALIPLVLSTVFVLMEPAFAKKAGKARIVEPWTKRLGSVCPTAQATVFLTWKISNANATKDGLETTVRQNFAVWTVGLMDGKKVKDSFLTTS